MEASETDAHLAAGGVVRHGAEARLLLLGRIVVKQLGAEFQVKNTSLGESMRNVLETDALVVKLALLHWQGHLGVLVGVGLVKGVEGQEIADRVAVEGLDSRGNSPFAVDSAVLVGGSHGSNRGRVACEGQAAVVGGHPGGELGMQDGLFVKGKLLGQAGFHDDLVVFAHREHAVMATDLVVERAEFHGWMDVDG